MTNYFPERDTVRLLNMTVTAVSGGRVTVGGVPNVPVYGPMPSVSAKVLVLEQGSTLLVLGNAVTLVTQVQELQNELSALKARMGGA
jgi:hypothetical protein